MRPGGVRAPPLFAVRSFGVRKTPFLRAMLNFTIKFNLRFLNLMVKIFFYQDRLGTDMGKVENKRGVF